MKLRVNARAAAALSRGVPVVARCDLTERREDLRAGALVTLVGPRDKILGRALWEPAGPVAARVIRHPDVRAALAASKRSFGPDTTAYRVLHGAADGVCGLSVDRFGDRFAVWIEGEAWKARRDEIDEALGGRAGGRDVVVLENGLRFEVHPGAEKPGLFLDMRENRARTRAIAKGRDVLNLFAYTGAFSVYCAAAGARRVVSVDTSARALERADRNLALNGLRGESLRTEASAYLARTSDRFDLVILDPPTFSRAPGRTESVERDYTRLVSLARRVLRPGGILAAALNTRRIPRERFAAWLGGRPTVHGEGRDFPALPGWPEGRALKFALTRLPPPR